MRTYSELTLEERVEIQQRLESGDSLRAIGRSLGRAASTISRECRRASADPASYRAQSAQQRSDQCRTQARVMRKLDDPALWETVQALLRARWSPALRTLSLGDARLILGRVTQVASKLAIDRRRRALQLRADLSS